MNISFELVGLDAQCEAIARQADEVAAPPLLRAVEGVVQRARLQWPVRTGKSRRLLSARRGRSGVAEVEVQGGADYTTEIRDGQTWRELVVEPLQSSSFQAEAGPPIVAELERLVNRESR